MTSVPNVAAHGPGRRGRGSRPRRSGALDGLRGLGMLAFMAFHFGVGQLAGAWSLINLFFVISGFLIVRLLVEERVRYGTIDVLSFYRRRARRLLPGLLALVTVLMATSLLTDGIERRRLGGDVLASLGFVMNWRLVAQSDEYFGDQALPSLLRHAWTLGIEEQFYLLVPFIVIALLRYLGARRRVVVGLLVATVVVTVWVVVLSRGGASFPRLYYGTDARLPSLLVGAALGALLARDRGGRSGLAISRDAMQVVGVVAAVLLVVAVVVFDPVESASLMYGAGGATALALVQAAVVAACVDPRGNALARLLSVRPLQELGRMIYALYLWHWPLAVLAASHTVFGSRLVTNILCFTAAVVVAYVSNRFLEEPILRRGVRALVPRQPMRNLVSFGTPVLAALVAAAVLLPSPSPKDAVADPVAPAAIPELVAGQPEHVAGRPAVVAVSGDSFAWYLAERFPPDTFDEVRVVNGAGEGCDLLDLPHVAADGLKHPDQWCIDNEETLPATLEEQDVDAFVQFGTFLTAVTHELPDGTRLGLGDREYEELVHDALDARLAMTQEAGVDRFFLANLPCRKVTLPAGQTEDALPQMMKDLYAEMLDPTRVNALLEGWAAQHEEVTLVDLYEAQCGDGYQDQVHGVQFSNDGLHVSPEATPMVWRWLLGTLSAEMGDEPGEPASPTSGASTNG